eukprot:4940250-Prymnesium_polylepis.1
MPGRRRRHRRASPVSGDRFGGEALPAVRGEARRSRPRPRPAGCTPCGPACARAERARRGAPSGAPPYPFPTF